MGNCMGSGESARELPVHTVYVSAFYIQNTETTEAQWEKVRAWGLDHGYTDLPLGSMRRNRRCSNGPKYPVDYVNWYAAVKWCNARSEKEGLTPCYSVNGTTFRTGKCVPDCNFSANGYRLPTEAEWEKAARGGTSGHRFPWSDSETISHRRANYNSSDKCVYDVSPTHALHPKYAGNDPGTGPVASFKPNGYGLYDMAGNVWEWCNDWFASGYYRTPEASARDPRGPASGEDRVCRGGCYTSGALPLLSPASGIGCERC